MATCRIPSGNFCGGWQWAWVRGCGGYADMERNNTQRNERRVSRSGHKCVCACVPMCVCTRAPWSGVWHEGCPHVRVLGSYACAPPLSLAPLAAKYATPFIHTNTGTCMPVRAGSLPHGHTHTHTHTYPHARARAWSPTALYLGVRLQVTVGVAVAEIPTAVDAHVCVT